MNIGFIGSGHVGQALASLFAQAGHSIVLSNRHGVTSLQDVIARLGNSNIKAGTIEDAAAQEIVVLAFPFNTLSQVQPKLLEGKLVIDATNYFPKRDGDLPKFIDHKIATSQYVANYFTGSRVVKAFNSFGVVDLPQLSARPAAKKIALPIAGAANDKTIVKNLIIAIGFVPYDAGELKDSFKIQADSNIFGFEGTRPELIAKLKG